MHLVELPECQHYCPSLRKQQELTILLGITLGPDQVIMADFLPVPEPDGFMEQFTCPIVAMLVNTVIAHYFI